MIQRRTPLKRSSKPIRRVSKKRARDMKTYSLLGDAFLKAHPLCQIWIKRNGYNETELLELYDQCDPEADFYWDGKLVPKSTEKHHSAGRGKNYLNVDTWIAASRDQHFWVHANPSAARRLGLLK